jgi:uncharacterized protein
VTARETAWRVFAAELNAATRDERATGEKATTYLLTPAGARLSRVLAAGILGPAQLMGADPAQPLYRATLTDATGSVAVTASSYQPSALAALRGWEAAGAVLVVGKAHLFLGRDGIGQTSIRAERVAPISDAELGEIRAEIAAQTEGRLSLVERARTGPRAAGDAPAPALWTDAAGRSVRAYPTVDLRSLRASLLGGRPEPPVPVAAGSGSAPAPPATARVPGSAADLGRASLSAAARAQESAFLDLVDELAENSADGCADLREVLQRAAVRGVREVAAEELLNRLVAAGVLEEPVVGRIRRSSAGPAP